MYLLTKTTQNVKNPQTGTNQLAINLKQYVSIHLVQLGKITQKPLKPKNQYQPVGYVPISNLYLVTWQR